MKPSAPRQVRDQIFGFLLQPLVLIRNRQPPSRFVQFLRNGPRDAALVRQAKNHRRLLSFAHDPPVN